MLLQLSERFLKRATLLALSALLALAPTDWKFAQAASTPSIGWNNGVHDAIVKEDHTVLVPILATHGANASVTEVLTITAIGIPLSWGTFSAPEGTYDATHGTWTVTLAPGRNLFTNFTFIPNHDSDADLSAVHVSVTAFDPANGSSGVASVDCAVVTDAVADIDSISASSPGAAQGLPASLFISGALTDTDGSESITGYQVSAVPIGFSLSAGSDAGGGIWSLTTANLSGLTVTPTAGFSGTVSLNATVFNAETNLSGQEVDFSDNTNSASTNFNVVWAVPEPSALVLSGLGATCLLAFRRRQGGEKGGRNLFYTKALQWISPLGCMVFLGIEQAPAHRKRQAESPR